MNVRIYKSQDFDQIQSWNQARKHPGFSKETIPPFGQIMDHTAAAFLIETDSGFAILDYYITNPKAPFMDRIYATKKMLEGAIERATERGFKYLIGYSKSRGGVRFSKRYGFNIDPKECFIFRKTLVGSGNFYPSGVRFYQEADFKTIEPWLCEKAKDWLKQGDLPPTGFMYDDVACIFVIKTDSKLAILDSFATNKTYSVGRRIHAAQAVLHAAENHVAADGFKTLLGNTRSAQALSLFAKNGFKYDEYPYLFIRKRLGLAKSKRIPDPQFGRIKVGGLDKNIDEISADLIQWGRCMSM